MSYLPLRLWLVPILISGILANNSEDCINRSYEGKCRKCPYNEEQTCHLAGPSVIYTNGTIYTADQDDPLWHKYVPKDCQFLVYHFDNKARDK